MLGSLQESNRLSSLDKYAGLRAWGLVLYGTLPANLTLIGTLEVKIGKINNLLPYLLPVCILPILLIFMLIRDRYKVWYLTVDLLNFRSVVTTTTIIILATSICGVSGIIQNKYTFGIPNNWNESVAIAESFLLAVASLVISSTFFMTILTKDVNLPGIPSNEIVKLLMKIRNNIRDVKGSKIWTEYISLNDGRLTNLVKEIENDVNQAAVCTGNHLTQKSLAPIREDIINLIKILGEIMEAGDEEAQKLTWKIFFEEYSCLSEPEKECRSQKKEYIDSLEKLRSLKLGGKYA